MESGTYALITLLSPLAGFILLAVFSKKIPARMAGLAGTLLLAVSTYAAFHIAYDYFFVSGRVGEVYQSRILFKIPWLFFSDALSIDMGILLDPIAAMMLVVVTLVSLMVHVYSIGYMKGEQRTGIYFSYLGLFTFSMLGLVLSTNLFQMYMFWELVGLSSFLLIGFYFTKPSARSAAKKAFIVTRFADLGFLIGILVLSYYGGSLDITTLLSALTDNDQTATQQALQSGFMGISALSWGLMLVFVGGAGKSALFPLHIWLPDAMEGPTPVSALIHAATMVVAGVYLVARLFPIYSFASETLQLVTYVGAFSAALAAIIACTQTDIKRVLAYSTMSQIGYMIFSLGLARYGGEAGLGFTASLFHLFTHALFKALLFLGAGAVIHYVHSNEVALMGGLSRKMPVTHLSFLIGCLSISGIPFFSGFYSKEEILLAAYQKDLIIYAVALTTSGLTAFYMFRLYFLIFWNRPQEKSAAHEVHGEGGWNMLAPLVLLAAGAVLAGYIPFGSFISSDGKPFPTHMDIAFSLLPVVFALSGIGVAYRMYARKNELPDRISRQVKGVYTAAVNKFYIDELYIFITKKWLFAGLAQAAAWLDKNIIDEIVHSVGDAMQWFAERIKKMQSGSIQQYTLYFLAGLLGILMGLLYLL